MGKFSPDLYFQELRAKLEKGEYGNDYKKMPDSELLESGGKPHCPNNKPLVEAAKRRVNIEEPK